MKRPLPTPSSATTLTLLLLSSSAITHAKKDKEEECYTIKKAAQLYDADNSGGLSREEFTQYWYGLGSDAGSSSDAGEVDAANTIMLMPARVSDMYTDLLCQCHDTFGFDENCCDDTATDDEIDATSGGGKGKGNTDEIWTEVSLKGFNEKKPKGDMKEYMEEFCWYVQDTLKKEGVTLDPGMDVVVTADAPTTEAPGSTTGATVPATAAAEEGTVATATAVTDAGFDIAGPDLISASNMNWTETNATEGITATTTSEATTTTTTEPTTTTTEATTTEAPVTTQAASFEWISTTAAAPETLKPIVLRFVGSTNGEVDAESVDLDDVTHAFWIVTLDVLEDIFGRRRKLSNNEQRQLEWDFGEQASVYFESVNMEVRDFDCPEGLVYAAEDSPCLRFKYTLVANPDGPLSPGTAEEFVDNFYSSVNENGAMYEALVEEYDDTEIIGIGNPGRGMPDPTEANNQQQTVILNSQGTNSTKSVQGSGFPVGGIIGIVVGAALLALVLVGFAFRRRRNKRRQQQELNDSNLSEDLEANEVNEDAANVEEWLDEEPEEGSGSSSSARPGTTSSPASSLAALGVASTVATRLSTGETEIMMTEKQPWTKNEPVV